MKLAGAEVIDKLTDSFSDMVKDESLDQRMNNRMLEKMQVTFEDLEGEDTFGLEDLSLETYRQDLLEEISKNKDKYIHMPNGVYTGFNADKLICPENGLIALLGYPARTAATIKLEYKSYDLIYINMKGKLVHLNQKDVLDALTFHKDRDRYVPNAIDKGDESAINELAYAIKTWLQNQAVDEQVIEDGKTKKTMGKEIRNLLSKLRKGDRDALSRIKQNIKADEKFQPENFDLVAI